MDKDHRPWLPDEIPLAGVRERSTRTHVLITVVYDNGLLMLGDSRMITAQQLLQDFVRLDGSPCGVRI